MTPFENPPVTLYDADFRIVVRRNDPVRGPRVAVVDTTIERAYAVRAAEAGQTRPPSWRAEVADRFDPDELREFEAALDKVAAPPVPGEVGGSGRLTARERELVARAQRLVTIAPDTRMWRAIAAEHVQHYLSGRWAAIYGAVQRRQDVPPNGAAPGYAIEFRAGTPERYRTPFGAPYAGGSRRPASDPAVLRSGDAMWATVRSMGLDPSRCVRQDREWPYTGIGTRAGVPELVPHDPKYFEDGDTMLRCTSDGPVVLARFDGRAGRWVGPS